MAVASLHGSIVRAKGKSAGHGKYARNLGIRFGSGGLEALIAVEERAEKSVQGRKAKFTGEIGEASLEQSRSRPAIASSKSNGRGRRGGSSLQSDVEFLRAAAELHREFRLISRQAAVKGGKRGKRGSKARHQYRELLGRGERLRREVRGVAHTNESLRAAQSLDSLCRTLRKKVKAAVAQGDSAPVIGSVAGAINSKGARLVGAQLPPRPLPGLDFGPVHADYYQSPLDSK